MGTKTLVPFVPRLTSDKIVEKKSKLDTLLSKVKQQILELRDEITSGGGQPTPEQLERMSYYRSVLLKLDKEQKTLASSIELADKEADIKQQELRKKAKEIRQTKEPGPVYMHELRAMNQKDLTPEDTNSRRAEAQKIKPVTASGGYTGFRVAPDLCKMDFNYFDEGKDINDMLWTGNGAIADIKARQQRR